jgi:hypothetical protein
VVDCLHRILHLRRSAIGAPGRGNECSGPGRRERGEGEERARAWRMRPSGESVFTLTCARPNATDTTKYAESLSFPLSRAQSYSPSASCPHTS